MKQLRRYICQRSIRAYRLTRSIEIDIRLQLIHINIKSSIETIMKLEAIRQFGHSKLCALC